MTFFGQDYFWRVFNARLFHPISGNNLEKAFPVISRGERKHDALRSNPTVLKVDDGILERLAPLVLAMIDVFYNAVYVAIVEIGANVSSTVLLGLEDDRCPCVNLVSRDETRVGSFAHGLPCCVVMICFCSKCGQYFSTKGVQVTSHTLTNLITLL